MSLEQSTELERAEVDVPDAVIEFFEPDIFARAGMRGVAPLAIPANAAIGTDIADLEPVRLFERRKFRGPLA